MTARVFHAEVWGLREVWEATGRGERTLTAGKYHWLLCNDVHSTDWTCIEPQAPFYLFMGQDAQVQAEYYSGWSIRDVMDQYGDPAPGIVTTQDEFAISWHVDEAVAKVQRFLKTGCEEEAREIWRLCSQSQWDYQRAKEQLRQGSWKRLVKPILYRPFDIRTTVYDSNVAVHRRERAMRHMLTRENVALALGRAGHVIHQAEWDILLCSRTITEFNLYRRGGNCLFPLYLYPDPKKDGELFANGSERHVNLNPDFLKALGEGLRLSFVADGTGDLKKTFGPEDVFHYIYAIFHSPTYRGRYAEFLKIDFPRVPLTADRKLFRTLCTKGEELVALHLLESGSVSKFITRYPVPGDNLVAKGHPRYLAPGEPEPGTDKPLKKGRIYISPDEPKSGKKGQCFEGVPPHVWEFHIGGYQVCEKWLKDRQGRKLSYDDLTHYQKVVVALNETTRLMEEIDAVIPMWPIA